MPSQSDKSSLHDARVVGVMAILFGLLYIPAFIHGYFWLWVFPFTGIATILLRSLLEDAINKVSVIEDSGQRSRAMSFRLFGVLITQVLVCSLPFISALWLHYLGILEISKMSAADIYFYDWALWFVPDTQRPKSIDLYNGCISIFLANLYFIFVCLISYLIFVLKKSLKARRIIFNVQLAPLDSKITQWGRDDKYELIIFGISTVLLMYITSGILFLSYDIEIVFIVILFSEFFPVFSVIYFITRFFMNSREVER